MEEETQEIGSSGNAATIDMGSCINRLGNHRGFGVSFLFLNIFIKLVNFPFILFHIHSYLFAFIHLHFCSFFFFSKII